ncbi:PIN domain-containing protein [Xanthobacter sp. AM11]|uniref:PIN domain-containing protein n=1 Tax=Xanthobacter sp. AM11 TaxID=3380643 RepID=UPI0039BEFDE3
MTRFFLDTNVILYTRDLKAQAKRERAAAWLRTLVARRLAVINVQVISEYCHVALRKMPYLTEADVRADSEALADFCAALPVPETIGAAWAIRTAHRFSWFDCMLLASAEGLGCSHFLSEDLHHGHAIGDMRIINPFLVSPNDLLAG